MSSYLVIIETLEMMGFTFVVAMRVAIAIKGIVSLTPFNLSKSLLDYRQKAYNDRIKHSKMLISMEKQSDIPFLQYIHQNKDKRTVKESIDDIYDLYNFYRRVR